MKLLERPFLLSLRQSYLCLVDAIERYLNIEPRTASLRTAARLTEKKKRSIMEPERKDTGENLKTTVS